MFPLPFIALAVAAAAPQTAPAAATTEAAAAAPARPRSETEQLRAEVADLRAQLQRSQIVADNARHEVEAARQQVALKDELLELGRARNAELFATATEILDRYRRKDFGAVLAGSEPFIQASRVHLENLVQDYEDKLRASRMTETTLPPSVEARMQRELEARQAQRAPDQPPADQPAPPQN